MKFKDIRDRRKFVGLNAITIIVLAPLMYYIAFYRMPDADLWQKVLWILVPCGLVGSWRFCRGCIAHFTWLYSDRNWPYFSWILTGLPVIVLIALLILCFPIVYVYNLLYVIFYPLFRSARANCSKRQDEAIKEQADGFD